MTDNPNIPVEPIQPPGQRRRWVPFALVIAIAVLIAAWIIWAQQFSSSGPAAKVGTIYPITPVGRPQANGTAAGNPRAKVVIDVYEDFQCPACKEFSQVIEPQIMQNLVATGQVYYVFHSFLIIDRATWVSPQKESHQAANAAMCAADQNRFWDYHDLLFNNWTGENAGDFTDPRLVAYAQTIHLDMPKFNACFTSNQFKGRIDADIAQAKNLGATGTPSVYVNGVQVAPGYVPGFNNVLDAVNKAMGK